jgi:hypothetical protein
MQRVIVLEHGIDLQSKFTIHEEVLVSYSSKLQQSLIVAMPLREKYVKCEKFFDRAESITLMATTPVEGEDKSVEELVSELYWRLLLK